MTLTRNHSPLRAEAGFAMPVVIGVTSIIMLLVGLGMTLTVRSIADSREDRAMKVARQAADSGLELALFRTNQALAGNTGAQPCFNKDAAGAYSYGGYDASGLWCAPVSDTLPDGTQATYRISREELVAGSSPPTYTRKVVASGTARGETRRVYAEVSARLGTTGYGIYGISAKDRIFLQNSAQVGSTTNPVDVRTNGDIDMQNNALICGNVTPGPGKTLTVVPPASLCPGMSTTPATTQLQFDNFDAEHAAARITNDNARLTCGGVGVRDAGSCSVQWSASTRQLTLDGTNLTLGGNVYSLCRLHLKGNAKLFIAARAPDAPPLKIYIGKPGTPCSGVPSEQVMIENGTGITNLNTDPVTLQIFVHGDTIVDFKNNTATTGTALMLYAPNASVMLQNHANISGGLVGKTVELKNNSIFNYDPDAATPTGNNALIYQPTQQLECTVAAPAGQPPNTGCK